MKRYIIEREIPGIHRLGAEPLSTAAKVSNAALAQLAPRVQWVHSYIAENQTFCLYLAESEDAVREHASISGFPATRITEISGMIDPTTAGA